MIKEREKLEHHPSLLLLPSDVETVLLGATMRAREREKEEIFEESKQHQQRRERERLHTSANLASLCLARLSRAE